MATYIEKIAKDSDLQSEFLRAKITANPFDYKVSNRIFFISSHSDFRKYNIYMKSDTTEQVLIDLLKCKTSVEYLKANSMLKLVRVSNDQCSEFESKNLSDDFFVNDGIFSMYNNLIARDDIIASAITPLDYVKTLSMFRTEKILEGLETWFIKCVDKGSLIPHLLYLNTEFNMYSLDDIDNLKFTKDMLDRGERPLIDIRNDDATPGDNSLLCRYCIPGDHCGYPAAEGYYTDPYYNNIQRMSIGLTTGYLMEMLYQLKDIAIKYPALIEQLQYNADNEFCKFFYTVIGDSLEINPKLESCFSKDNTTRFDNFRTYYNEVLMNISSKLSLNEFYDNYFKLPKLLGFMAASMQQYAYQQLRIKHLMLFYTECKNKGVDLKDAFRREISDDELGLPGMPTSGGSEDPSNELLDLGMEDYSSDLENHDDDVLNTPAKKYKADPVLDAVDTLKRDLHDSKYKFEVNYIKSSPEQQEAYNKVAENIKMLSVNLSKQIKEIKVYNTGGKCNGQSRGKLDKKNLWKYRTDHNIFYNNNYKIKEMDLAFGIVLDESGSMSGDGIKNGRVVMILLHEVLTSLGINHSIIGHTSHGEHNTIINKYYQFKEEAYHTLQKPYALAKINSKSGNCDSGALYYMQSVMKSVQNKDKIVIIFSDGEPTECSDSELKEQVRDMEKSGIHVIGVGIDFDCIKEYYPDHANGRNLKEMIDIVVSILKRYVLEKKD